MRVSGESSYYTHDRRVAKKENVFEDSQLVRIGCLAKAARRISLPGYQPVNLAIHYSCINIKGPK